jgi:hypothetical protein
MYWERITQGRLVGTAAPVGPTLPVCLRARSKVTQ